MERTPKLMGHGHTKDSVGTTWPIPSTGGKKHKFLSFIVQKFHNFIYSVVYVSVENQAASL